MAMGRLRIHLGVAPGVGATHALVDEGRRRRQRGSTVVVGRLDAPVPDFAQPDAVWDADRLLGRVA